MLFSFRIIFRAALNMHMWYHRITELSGLEWTYLPLEKSKGRYYAAKLYSHDFLNQFIFSSSFSEDICKLHKGSFANVVGNLIWSPANCLNKWVTSLHTWEIKCNLSLYWKKGHFNVTTWCLVVLSKSLLKQSPLSTQTTKMKFSLTSTPVNSYKMLDLILTNQLMLRKRCRLKALSFCFKK